MTQATAHTLYTRLTHFSGAQSLPTYHDFTSVHAREQIRLRGLAEVQCAERMTFSRYFEATYGEPLEPKVRKRA